MGFWNDTGHSKRGAAGSDGVGNPYFNAGLSSGDVRLLSTDFEWPFFGQDSSLVFRRQDLAGLASWRDRFRGAVWCHGGGNDLELAWSGERVERNFLLCNFVHDC